MTATPPKAPERGVTGAAVDVAGVLGLERVAEGSRSERAAPVVRAADGRGFPVHVVGDNPFEEPTLARLRGRAVAVRGVWANGVVRVQRDDLHALPDDPHGRDDGEATT